MSRVIENPKELILTEAKKILYNEGYANVSIRRVAKECNIAVGTIYNYYPTKKELIIEMMINFWDEYFCNIELILNSKEEFYSKLRNIFNTLQQFISKFREIWLKNSDIYSTPDYIESGLKKENIYIDKLITTIEKLLEKEFTHQNYMDSKERDANKLSKFIVMNFITMVQMPYFDYEFFENILRKVIQ